MLLIDAGETAATAPVLRTGGVPLVPEGFVWPVCRECDGHQQFLAHLPVDGGAVSVFFCQNDPGLCDDWDPSSGGNRAFLFPSDGPGLAPAAVPAEGETLLGAVTALRVVPSAGPDDTVLGQWGGAPEWIQGDETPDCPSCAAPMGFTAALEEGRDHTTSANFGGGGCAYVFHCAPCAEAVFLWQC